MSGQDACRSIHSIVAAILWIDLALSLNTIDIRPQIKYKGCLVQSLSTTSSSSASTSQYHNTSLHSNLSIRKHGFFPQPRTFGSGHDCSNHGADYTCPGCLQHQDDHPEEPGPPGSCSINQPHQRSSDSYRTRPIPCMPRPSSQSTVCSIANNQSANHCWIH
jgi:hypothetical protein